MGKLPALCPDEIETQYAELLPARETLASACYFACVDLVNVVGVNLAVAVNAASINASANAIANQAIGVFGA